MPYFEVTQVAQVTRRWRVVWATGPESAKLIVLNDQPDEAEEETLGMESRMVEPDPEEDR